MLTGTTLARKNRYQAHGVLGSISDCDSDGRGSTPLGLTNFIQVPAGLGTTFTGNVDGLLPMKHCGCREIVGSNPTICIMI